MKKRSNKKTEDKRNISNPDRTESKPLDIGTFWTLIALGVTVLTAILGIAGAIPFFVALLLLLSALVVTTWALARSQHVRRWSTPKRILLLFSAAAVYFGVATPALLVLYHRDFSRPTYILFEPLVCATLDGRQAWMFAARLRGGEVLSNVQVMWRDEAEPFNAERLRTWSYSEVDPEPPDRPVWRPQLQFPWLTPDPDHEHYSIETTYRNGAQDQDLRIERVSSAWFCATRVRGQGHEILLECKDPGFPNGLGYDSVLTPCWPDFPKGYYKQRR